MEYNGMEEVGGGGRGRGGGLRQCGRGACQTEGRQPPHQCWPQVAHCPSRRRTARARCRVERHTRALQPHSLLHGGTPRGLGQSTLPPLLHSLRPRATESQSHRKGRAWNRPIPTQSEKKRASLMGVELVAQACKTVEVGVRMPLHMHALAIGHTRQAHKRRRARRPSVRSSPPTQRIRPRLERKHIGRASLKGW